MAFTCSHAGLVTKFPEFSRQEVTHYLVKWCSLPYEESTWELEEDVDPAKVKEFESLQVLPEVKHVVMCLCVCLTPLVTCKLLNLEINYESYLAGFLNGFFP